MAQTSSPQKTSPQKPSPQKPNLGHSFWIIWILCNIFAYGVGLGLPILVADLQWAYDYVGYIVTAIITFGFWVCLAQWLLLRRQIPLSPKWILNTAIAPVISAVLPLTLVSQSRYALLLIFITYPLTHALLQWRLLRKSYQPARGWILAGVLADLLSSAIVVAFFSVLSAAYLMLPVSVITTLSGMLYGLLYGAITSLGLRWLVKQAFIATEKDKSGLDVPPGTKSWQVTLLPTLGLFVIAILWLVVIPPPPSIASQVLPDWLIPLSIVGLLFAYIYVSILIHELGHLLFAIANGFEIQAVSVHRWIMSRSGKRWKLSKTQRQYAGGFVLPIPKSLKHFKSPALMAMIFGGPFASFLLFCAGAILLVFPQTDNFTANFFVWLLIAFSGTNLYKSIFYI